MEKRVIRYKLNGVEREDYIDPRLSLTDLIRGEHHMTGTKKGCEVGECGACTVIIDGRTYDSCIYLALWADGKEITTIEGLSGPCGELTDVQQAFIDEGAVQCGYCTPGMILTATTIADSGIPYDREELKRRISGNFCRCTGYENILNAIEKVIRERRESEKTSDDLKA